MLTKLIVNKLFGKTRLSFNCPNCREIITIDKDTFPKSKGVIECGHCNLEYNVIEIKDTGINLTRMLDNEKNSKGNSEFI